MADPVFALGATLTVGALLPPDRPTEERPKEFTAARSFPKVGADRTVCTETERPDPPRPVSETTAVRTGVAEADAMVCRPTPWLMMRLFAASV